MNASRLTPFSVCAQHIDHRCLKRTPGSMKAFDYAPIILPILCQHRDLLKASSYSSFQFRVSIASRSLPSSSLRFGHAAISQNKQMQDSIVSLNNYLQSTGQLSSLTWRTSTSGLPHEPRWTCYCVISGDIKGVGTGTHQHIAKKMAATIALRALGQG
ncbi:hypothetical protein BJ138DRAFT_916766 [Hygrophoropsis aurantiaca]|uniref:Uncharacterized protein n=1 Tax=Hygrophoropsis aurantiaca TaxID=72124 RepID=A0ACB8AR63_9AGAM|nr:hypothetical protein BJ138DRAFT_916766 [Hygrophoropsis aurantiaca]